MATPFSVTVQGQQTLTDEVNAEIQKIDSAIAPAMYIMGSEFEQMLNARLRQDWYDAYKPHKYPRRTDSPIFGDGLMSEEYKDYNVEETKSYTGRQSKRRLTFTYEPSGQHAIEEYHTRDKNALIRSIETGKLFGNPPPRPFWENFVDELATGDVMDIFITAMKPYEVILDGEDDRYINFNSSYLIK